jgi:PAS domain S-box-containing protein
MLTDTLLTIIERNADGILVIDKDGRVRFCNPAAEAIFGKHASELVDTIFGFPVGSGATTEIDILRRGEAITAEMRVVEIEWEGVRAYLASLRDVTERKLAQTAILLRNKAIEASATGIMIIDAKRPERPLIYVNPAFEAMTGYPTWEVIDRSARFLYECNPHLDVNRRLDEALELGRDVVEVVECERKDGSLFWSELRFSPIYDDAHELTQIVGVQHDITLRKLLEAEQIEKERIKVALDKERELRELKDRFLTMMSHELRTPLALIRLSYDMLHQYGQKASAEERSQYLDSIRAQVDHLTDLVSDVMTVSRAERMKEDFMPEDIDLLTYVRGIVEEFQLNYHKTHRVNFTSPPAMIQASVDRKLLRQALTNLISNAIKYSSPGSEVDIALSVERQTAVIEILDEGIGIPAEDHPRLFEPFHRGRNAEVIPGTGLGLSIARQAVQAHGGSIQVESSLGHGSRFTIRLPLIMAREQVRGSQSF